MASDSHGRADVDDVVGVERDLVALERAGAPDPDLAGPVDDDLLDTRIAEIRIPPPKAALPARTCL